MKSFIILISLLVPTLTLAADNTGNYAVWGMGKKSCYAFSKAIAESKTEHYKHYMKGFLTAYNIFTEQTYSISARMNENQIIEWLDEYCGENPMSSMENALTSFTFEHYDKRMKSSSSGVGR